MKVHFDKEKNVPVSPEFVKAGMEGCYKYLNRLRLEDSESGESVGLVPGGVNMYIAVKSEEGELFPDTIQLVVRRKKYKWTAKTLVYEDEENHIYIYKENSPFAR